MVSGCEPKGAWLQEAAVGARARLEEDRRLYGHHILLPAVNEMLDQVAAQDHPVPSDTPNNVTYVDFIQKKEIK